MNCRFENTYIYHDGSKVDCLWVRSETSEENLNVLSLVERERQCKQQENLNDYEIQCRLAAIEVSQLDQGYLGDGGTDSHEIEDYRSLVYGFGPVSGPLHFVLCRMCIHTPFLFQIFRIIQF